MKTEEGCFFRGAIWLFGFEQITYVAKIISQESAIYPQNGSKYNHHEPPCQIHYVSPYPKQRYDVRQFDIPFHSPIRAPFKAHKDVPKVMRVESISFLFTPESAPVSDGHDKNNQPHNYIGRYCYKEPPKISKKLRCCHSHYGHLTRFRVSMPFGLLKLSIPGAKLHIYLISLLVALLIKMRSNQYASVLLFLTYRQLISNYLLIS